MSRCVVLLLFMFLVGCSGTTRGVRHGTRHETRIPRGALRFVPQGATAAAEAGTAAATGEALVAGGAVIVAGASVVLVCLTAQAALEGRETPLDIADTFYGTHFGDLQGWAEGCYASSTETEKVSEPHAPPTSQASPDAAKDRNRKRWGRIYVTYTKLNVKTQRYYSGRTSMVIDLAKPLRFQAQLAVEARDANHHLDENDEPRSPGFLPAVIDRFDTGRAVNYETRYDDIAYWRIRGREQQLIDSWGGAQSDTRKAQEPVRTENKERGVAKDNPQGKRFHDAATSQWGELHPYTGN